MKHYIAHFNLSHGVSLTLNVQFEIDHYSIERLYTEMDVLGARLGATLAYLEDVE